ncbi:MAG: hypothetical protein GVY14_01860 [Spirochaetes bacterium]|nr:hypothetical protein [Spirochaetota bacterium]
MMAAARYALLRPFLRLTEHISRAASGADGVVEEQPQHFDRLTVDTGRRRVYLDADRVEPTAKEFDLLPTLCRHPGQAFSRAKLLEIVWGYGYSAGYSCPFSIRTGRPLCVLLTSRYSTAFASQIKVVTVVSAARAVPFRTSRSRRRSSTVRTLACSSRAYSTTSRCVMPAS